MKTFKIFVLAMIGIFVMSVASFAQNGPKIGYLDLSKLFDNYEKTKEFDAILEQKHKDYEKERNVKVDKMKEAQGKLDLMKQEEKAKLEQEIDQMRNDLVAFDQSRRTDLLKQRDERIREILLEIEKVSSDFAKKENFDYILNDRVLIYGSETLNVTDKILNVLNENYNKKAAPAAGAKETK